MGAAIVAEALRDPLDLDRRRILFACVDRHDLNSSMNCDKQQNTVGLWATRSKALESRSKLVGFQYCEARGQAPPLKVASMPVRKRRLIAFVHYRTAQPKSTDYDEVHIASRTVPPGVDPPAAGRWEDKPGAPLVGVRDVPGRAVMKLGAEGQLSAGSIHRFRPNVEGTMATHPPDDLGL